ncbi:MAG: hypothetical protein IJD59_02630 [Clostridia bacterium]|nr:hypothetical protein [Clostridia bacterium]
MEMNGLMREAYEKLLGIFAKEDAKASLLYDLKSDLYSALYWVRYWARSDEEKAFAGECEDRAVDYYQRALECNYDALRRYKETGDEGIPGFRNLLMTVDADETPTKTRVIGVRNGAPVFADGCQTQSIQSERNYVDRLIGELRRWMDYGGTLREKLEKALALKARGPLGISEPPKPSDGSKGMTREQSEANAWRNYAIEAGTITATHYDDTLDRLIVSLKKCMEFYEKATSIV